MATSAPLPVDDGLSSTADITPQRGEFNPFTATTFSATFTAKTAEEAEALAIAEVERLAFAEFGAATTAFGNAPELRIKTNSAPRTGILSYTATYTARASFAELPDPVPAPPPPPPPPPEPSQLNVDPFDVPEFETLIEPPEIPPRPSELNVDPFDVPELQTLIEPPDLGEPDPGPPTVQAEPINVDLDNAQEIVGFDIDNAQEIPVTTNEPAPVNVDLDNAQEIVGFDTDNAQEILNPAQTAADQTVAGKDNAITQPATAALTKQPENGDWRLKIRLAANANYLYKEPNILSGTAGSTASVLLPLAITDGVIFPYTPDITTAYRADYDNYSLTHSNYRGYFYKSSFVDSININADFTAQDTFEANYMLAMIHFFRSVTKMFYGRDTQAGAPPPLVYINGLGQFQYNNHPCLVSQFNYSLPNNVDYVRAGSVLNLQQNLLTQRPRQSVATNPLSNAVNRLRNAFGFVPQGGQQPLPQPPTLSQPGVTYVPTKISVQLTLLPVQTRGQVSKEFNLKDYASGALLKKGYW